MTHLSTYCCDWSTISSRQRERLLNPEVLLAHSNSLLAQRILMCQVQGVMLVLPASGECLQRAARPREPPALPPDSCSNLATAAGRSPAAVAVAAGAPLRRTAAPKVDLPPLGPGLADFTC